MNTSWDSFVPPPALWDECLRILRPGGHLAAFAGSRTYDLMGISIRLAGFEIRDGLNWIFGSGMAHGQKVAAGIEKLAGPEEAVRWDGWNTALKPAHEPIVLARRPLSETSVARNTLAHGTGAINAGAVRTAHRSAADLDESSVKNRHGDFGTAHGLNHVYGNYATLGTRSNYDGSQGRFPTNVLLTHSATCQHLGQKEVPSDSHHPAARGPGGIGSTGHRGQSGLVERQASTETVDDYLCAPDCPIPALDDQSGRAKAVGGASRFFPTSEHDPLEDAVGFQYSAKAPPKERPVITTDTGEDIRHVSVKPLRIMDWLIRLLTPAGGTVLDPFAGSGTTLEAARAAGFSSIGIEREDDYIRLIEARLSR